MRWWLCNGRHDQTEIRSLFGKRTMNKTWKGFDVWRNNGENEKKNTHFYRNETLDDIILLKVLFFLFSFEIFVKKRFLHIFFLNSRFSLGSIISITNEKIIEIHCFFPLLSLFDCELLLLLGALCCFSLFHSFEWKCVVFIFTLFSMFRISFLNALCFFFHSLALFPPISGYSLTNLNNNK